MYCVKKVLNNNAVLAVDLHRKEDVVCMGKGGALTKKSTNPLMILRGLKSIIFKNKPAKALQKSLLTPLIRCI